MTITADERVLRRLHSRILDEFVGVVLRISGGDLHRPTPCTDWDVAALLEHQVAQNDAMTWAVEGGGPDLDRWRPQPLSEPQAEVRRTTERLRTLLADDRVWDRRVWMPEISETFAFTTAQAIRFHFVDTVAHAWDVAVATGRPVHVDDDELALAVDVAQQVPVGAPREVPGAAFTAPVRMAAAPGSLDAVLAHLGRDPAWRPPVPSTP